MSWTGVVRKKVNAQLRGEQKYFKWTLQHVEALLDQVNEMHKNSEALSEILRAGLESKEELIF